MRGATYTRISTDEDHQPYSLEAQAARLESYVGSQDGWTLARSFSDQLSGATLERPGLRRALQEAKVGRFDLLLVYRVDRLARSVRSLAQILEELDQAGVAFRSATEPFDTSSPAGRMMVQMLGVFAEFERATIIDRVIAGMERKAARGGWMGGPAPFGYRIENGELAVNESEAALVPRMFELYARRRLGARAVANWMNARGHRSRNGKPWSHMTVLTVIRNRTYLGDVHFRGRWHKGTHPALLDHELFEAAAAILAERGEDRSTRATNSSEYLLSGLMVCGRCGKHMVGNAANGRLYRYRYYTCFSRQRYGKVGCTADRLPADELDRAVLIALLKTYEDAELFNRVVYSTASRSAEDREQREAELAAVRSELSKTEEAIERYLAAFEAGSLPEDQCGARVRALGARTAELRDRQGELQAALDALTAEPPTAGEIESLRNDIARAIEGGPVTARKSFVQALVQEVRAEDRSLVVPTFRVPMNGQLPRLVREPSRVVGGGGFEPP